MAIIPGAGHFASGQYAKGAVLAALIIGLNAWAWRLLGDAGGMCLGLAAAFHAASLGDLVPPPRKADDEAWSTAANHLGRRVWITAAAMALLMALYYWPMGRALQEASGAYEMRVVGYRRGRTYLPEHLSLSRMGETANLVLVALVASILFFVALYAGALMRMLLQFPVRVARAVIRPRLDQ